MLQTRLIPGYKNTLKGTVAPVWVWLNLYGWKEQKQEKNLKFFYSPLTFNNVNRNTMFQRKGMEIATFCQKPLDNSASSSIG
jgi:hypothetical protein